MDSFETIDFADFHSDDDQKRPTSSSAFFPDDAEYTDVDEDDADERAPVRQADDSELTKMMKRLAKEEEMGTFRALAPEYARAAAKYHREQAGDHIPPAANTAFGATGHVLRLGSEDGPILATGYRRTIADEHGFFVEFGFRQLHPDMRLQRQSRTKFSDEYGWTRFKAVGTGVDVYFAGDDPFLMASASVAAVPPAVDPEPADVRPPRGQVAISHFFASVVPPATKKARTVPAKKAPAQKGRRKHAQFGRNVFYVKVLDNVWCG